VYDGLGNQVSRSSPDTGTTTFEYDAAGELVMESHGVTGEVLKHYIRVGGQLLAILSQGTNATGQPTAASLYYVHSDHLGTPQALTDQSGQVVWSIAYDPFGQATVNEDPDGDGTSIEFNLRFPGQYYDKYSGVNYNYYRDYDPTLGRYLQSDPVGILRSIDDPQRQIAAMTGVEALASAGFENLNHNYGYAYQNPLIFTDPTGEWAGLITVGVVATIVGGGLYFIADTAEKCKCKHGDSPELWQCTLPFVRGMARLMAYGSDPAGAAASDAGAATCETCD
jgi:RHS repeat-associated protein